MANRIKEMNLTEIVAHNLKRICQEHDLSSRELAGRADMPQKTVYNMIHGKSSAQMQNVEKLCRTLIVSPTAMVTPHLPVNILMSRRVPRLVEKYSKLSMDDRDRIETLIDQMLGIEPQEVE